MNPILNRKYALLTITINKAHQPRDKERLRRILWILKGWVLMARAALPKGVAVS